jgi:hypothetical protein
MSPLLLRLRLPSVFFPPGFTSMVMIFSSQMLSACLTHLIHFDFFTLQIIFDGMPTNYYYYYYYYGHYFSCLLWLTPTPAPYSQQHPNCVLPFTWTKTKSKLVSHKLGVSAKRITMAQVGAQRPFYLKCNKLLFSTLEEEFLVLVNKL